jgi:hypothetical protein
LGGGFWGGLLLVSAVRKAEGKKLMVVEESWVVVEEDTRDSGEVDSV